MVGKLVLSNYDNTVCLSETHENHSQMQRINGNATIHKQIKQRKDRA